MKKLLFILILFCSIQGFGQTKGYWRMNGNSNDASGNGYNGTDTGITYSQANGRLGQGAGFNGSNSIIYCQSNSFDFYNTAPYTMSLWLRLNSLPASTKTNDIIMIQDGTTVARDKGIIIDANGAVGCYVYDGATKTAMSANGKITTGKWYHLTHTYDGTYINIYVDGVFVAKTAVSGTYNHTNPRIVLSRWDVSQTGITRVNGAIDEAIVDDTAWSPAKVKNEYARIKGFF